MDTVKIAQIVKAIEALIGENAPKMSDIEQMREGGWFCLLDVREEPNGVVLAHERIGRPRTDKDAKYCVFSLEKATRLASHPEHMTSRESRDEASAQYGGAVRAHGYILSFSGLPEIFDEGIMLLVALDFDLLTLDEVRSLSNAVFEELMLTGHNAAV